ncbi:MAG TPA: helix-turn-helix domain-containing protein [Mycobacterium sp.]|nr:helix-turn-helix domain-containing protein [Mycobacterium sp.]
MTVTSQLGRPVGANGEETRRRIIAAAMRCVAEKGYSQASIREIAREAQMTSGSLYHYFPNKSELLKATVGEIEDVALPRLRAAAQRRGDVIDRLEALLDESDRLMREYPHLAAFERAIRAESAAYLRRGDPDRVGFKALRDIISDIVDDARQCGGLGADSDSAGAVNAIYALTRGLTEQAANLPPEAYHATLRSAKQLIRGTLFGHQAKRSGAQRH